MLSSDVTAMHPRVGSVSRGRDRLGLAFIGLLSATLGLLVAARTASAATVTYTSIETIPVPPASSYAGGGGGDGWDVSLSSTEVFNVFHHSGSLSVACHKQSDASACYPTRQITDNGLNFSSSSHSGTYFAPSSGKLWVYATRSDGIAGVVCVDTLTAAVNTNPFCGFVQLTAAGDGGITSVPMKVGHRLYAFNYLNGIPSGGRDKLLCFDTTTEAACASQPFAVDIGAGAVGVGSFPVPATALIGDQMIIPIYTEGVEHIACWDDSLQADCAGLFPLSPGIGYAGSNGSAFPMLNASGGVTGFCLPTFNNQCFALDGTSVATPANMTTAIGATDQWNGPGVAIGPRVYLVTGNSDTVRCYDYSASAGCPNFPHATPNASFIYTVNPDPQRPTCLWINADGGSAQIQNFDAFTGGACGQGAIRVLSSQFIVPQEKCNPSAYRKIEILQPARAGYTDGTIGFADPSGNPIPGIADKPIDAAGAVDVTGVGLEALSSLQFLITLNTPAGAPMEVVLKLTWEATYDPDCIDDGTQTTLLTLTPATAENPVGSLHTVTADLTNPSGSDAGQTILFSVSGVNTASGSDVTDAAGSATFSYKGTNAGNDTITACFDANGNATCDQGELTATASKTWIGGSACTGLPAPTYESIDCRLDALIADLNSASDLGTLARGLMRQVARARKLKIRSEVAHANGNGRKAEAALRHSIRWMIGFNYRLASLTGKGLLPQATAARLAAQGDPIERDMRTLLATI